AEAPTCPTGRMAPPCPPTPASRTSPPRPRVRTGCVSTAFRLSPPLRAGILSPAGARPPESRSLTPEYPMRRARPTVMVTLLLLAAAGPARAQAPDSIPGFSSRQAMIPMRDGARLHTRIYRPLGHDEPLPLLMVRTPYGIDGRAARMLPNDFRELVSEGYVFVFQDIRGRYGSDGEFVMNRPLHVPSDTQGVDETTDTWDTVEWLVRNVAANNGRV